MKIVRNDALIKRNATISQYVLFAALATLVIGIYFTITKNSADEIGWAYLFLIPAYILVQVSISMGNRWSRSPRPDEVVSQSLKGLDNDFTLYIHTTAVPHLLVGPAGVWIIKTYYQSGRIYLDEKKKTLKQKGGGNFFTKLFASEGIGDVQHDSEILLKRLDKYFQKREIPNIQNVKMVNVFSHPDVKIEAKDYAEAITTSEKLKDFMRRAAKQVNMPLAEIEQITAKLPNK